MNAFSNRWALCTAALGALSLAATIACPRRRARSAHANGRCRAGRSGRHSRHSRRCGCRRRHRAHAEARDQALCMLRLRSRGVPAGNRMRTLYVLRLYAKICAELSRLPPFARQYAHDRLDSRLYSKILAMSCSDLAYNRYPLCVAPGTFSEGACCRFPSQCQDGECGGGGTNVCSLCGRALDEGELCGMTGTLCRPGLECVDGVCSKSEPHGDSQFGEECDPYSKLCAPGLRCLAMPGDSGAGPDWGQCATGPKPGGPCMLHLLPWLGSITACEGDCDDAGDVSGPCRHRRGVRLGCEFRMRRGELLQAKHRRFGRRMCSAARPGRAV